MASRQRRARRNVQSSNVLPESELAELTSQRVTRSYVARIVSERNQRALENTDVSSATTATASRRGASASSRTSAAQSRGSSTSRPSLPAQRSGLVAGRPATAIRRDALTTTATDLANERRSRSATHDSDASSEAKKRKKNEGNQKKDDKEMGGSVVTVIERKLKMLCPICMDDFLEDNLPASCTSCGHIICTPCISQIMAPGENYCPLCCRRQTARDIRKVFLPAATFQ